jgi:hypothetical protein
MVPWAAVLSMRMKTMAQKVDAKNAMKPEATAMRRLANQPMFPSGTPKRVPAPEGREFAEIEEDCVIQLE